MPVGSGHNVLAAEFGPLVTAFTNGTISNTSAETVLATYTVPANTAGAADSFPFQINGHADITGTPTVSFRLRIGGIGGTQLALVTYTAAANTARPWELWGSLKCVSPGAGATWHGFLSHMSRIAGGAAPGISAVWQDCTISAQTKDSTVNQDFVITGQWSVASASNTIQGHECRIWKTLG
jgi:hypothetical protein